MQGLPAGGPESPHSLPLGLGELPIRSHTRLAQHGGKPALAKIDQRATESESLDLEAVLKFAGRLLGDPAEMWRLGNLEQRQRLQRLLFPEGVVWSDGRVKTVVTCRVVEYLRATGAPEKEMARLISEHWNHVKQWGHQVDALRQPA